MFIRGHSFGDVIADVGTFILSTQLPHLLIVSYLGHPAKWLLRFFECQWHLSNVVSECCAGVTGVTGYYTFMSNIFRTQGA